MNKNLDIISYAVSLIIKAAIIAARFSGRVRKRSLKRLAAMDMTQKTVPENIEQRLSQEARTTGDRLKDVA